MTAALIPSQTATVPPTEIFETPIATPDIASTVIAMSSPSDRDIFFPPMESGREKLFVMIACKLIGEKRLTPMQLKY